MYIKFFIIYQFSKWVYGLLNEHKLTRKMCLNQYKTEGTYMYNFEEFISKIEINYSPWDDYGYKTTAYINLDNKIAYFNIYPNTSETYNLIKSGIKPNDPFFVLGGVEYYDLINSSVYGQADREKWYNLTNDLAFNLSLLEKYRITDYTLPCEPGHVIKTSFLRTKTLDEVKYQFNRMTKGGKYLEPFNITIYNSINNKIVLDINTNPATDIPENNFGLIGKNGSGKTFILNNMASLFLKQKSNFYVLNEQIFNFSKVIRVSYSPFDDFEIANKIECKYERIGFGDGDSYECNNKSIYEYFNKEITDCIEKMMVPSNESFKGLWYELLDKINYEKWIVNIIDSIETNFDYKFEALREEIKKLSSGQKIVLLTITKLILAVREKSLVLIDEPELFLHPSLLKSYVRIILQIITRMNSVGIIATHNPLVLQELQTNCVKITKKNIDDTYEILNLEEQGINSYGENVNVLNDVVFGIDIQNTGYYQYLTSLNISELNEKRHTLFNKLGSEGRVLLKYLTEEKNERD